MLDRKSILVWIRPLRRPAGVEKLGFSILGGGRLTRQGNSLGPGSLFLLGGAIVISTLWASRTQKDEILARSARATLAVHLLPPHPLISILYFGFFCRCRYHIEIFLFLAEVHIESELNKFKLI